MNELTIDGGILAGGLGTRMEGQAKGLIEFRGQAMAARVSSAIRPFVDKLYISCNDNAEDYLCYGDATLPDLIPGHLGPLAGLHTLLSSTKADYLLVSTCDTPLLTEFYGYRMCSALKQWPEDTSKPLVFVAKGERSHPLHLLISAGCKQSLENYLNIGERRVTRWLDSLKPVDVLFEDDSLFSNANSPQDIEQLESITP